MMQGGRSAQMPPNPIQVSLRSTCIYGMSKWMDKRWVLRFTFLFFSPNFFLILSLWVSTVLADRLSNSAVSFVLLPCFTRFATWISEGVSFRYPADSPWINGETMSFRFDSTTSAKPFCLPFSPLLFNFSKKGITSSFMLKITLSSKCFLSSSLFFSRTFNAVFVASSSSVFIFSSPSLCRRAFSVRLCSFISCLRLSGGPGTLSCLRKRREKIFQRLMQAI